MQKNDEIILKLMFYILSLWLFFGLAIVLTIEIPHNLLSKNIKCIKLMPIIKENIVSIASFIGLIICVIIYFKLIHRFKGATELPCEITEVKDKNYDHMTFVTTYIIPLLCFDLEDIRYQILVLILLIVLSVMFIKTKLSISNPTLLLLGFNLYEIKVPNREAPILVITKDKIRKEMYVKSIILDEDIWYVKENK